MDYRNVTEQFLVVFFFKPEFNAYLYIKLLEYYSSSLFLEVLISSVI